MSTKEFNIKYFIKIICIILYFNEFKLVIQFLEIIIKLKIIKLAQIYLNNSNLIVSVLQ